MMDFRTAYSSARCLLRHCDPYNPNDVLRIYHAEGGERPSDSDWDRFSLSRNTYFPTEFPITVLFAFLPFYLAQLFWFTLTAGSFILASFLMWNLAADQAPELAGGLLGLLLAYSEQVIYYGNPAGIAIGLCVVAVWCFLRDKFVPAGILCLAASLALKPHDAALVWLYFLLAGGSYRRRALQTLAVVAAFSLPAILWITHISPHWIQEVRSNWQAFSVRGGGADPGPTALDNHGTLLITDLQSVFGVFRDDPRFYNFASYLVCAPMLLAWAVVTLRARITPATAWFALAAIAPLSMLPMYHRIYDAKLVMLTIPACALLWAERGRIGRIALLINAAGFVLTGDYLWSIYLRILIELRLLPAAQPGPLLSATLLFPLPLILLIMGAFYLCIYARRTFHPVLLE